MSNQEELTKIAEEIKKCQKCPLYKTAINPVPGNGNSNSKIMLIGEAPGYNEDQKGIPFCGQAGNLLDQLLLMVGIQRKDVFVANILKHRPPENRDPLPEEITACTPFLKQQILTIKPIIVITLGRFSMNYFLPDVYISKVHGQIKKIIWEELNLLVYPVYHPAAALRSGQMMSVLREDFKRIPDIIKNTKEEAVVPMQPTSTPEAKQESLF